MIVYIPQRIESAEQAEALPAGTLAWHLEGTGVDHAHKVAPLPGHHEGGWITLAGYAVNFQIIGWSALVPVEAHTQDHTPTPGWGEHMRRHRHVTEWLDGPSPDRRGDCA